MEERGKEGGRERECNGLLRDHTGSRLNNSVKLSACLFFLWAFCSLALYLFMSEVQGQ